MREGMLLWLIYNIVLLINMAVETVNTNIYIWSNSYTVSLIIEGVEVNEERLPGCCCCCSVLYSIIIMNPNAATPPLRLSLSLCLSNLNPNCIYIYTYTQYNTSVFLFPLALNPN